MHSRRFATIPGYFVVWTLWIGSAPLWLVATAITDVVRRNGGATLRSGAFLTSYLTCEVIGILASGATWIWKQVTCPSPERWAEVHYRLESLWGAALFHAMVRIFSLRLKLEGQEESELGRGPYLLLLRHASTADTLVGAALVSHPYRIRLRYVLKKELLWDPCLDIVGHRVPNVFVDRASDDSAEEIGRVSELGRDLGARDAVLIYPEGTRFSRSKKQRILERLHRQGNVEMLEYGRSLEHVLPPRASGTLALLEACPNADVVICAHTGFEHTVSLGDIWKGGLQHQVIRVRFQRVRRTAIPDDSDQQTSWLLDQWRRLDDWIVRHCVS